MPKSLNLEGGSGWIWHSSGRGRKRRNEGQCGPLLIFEWKFDFNQSPHYSSHIDLGHRSRANYRRFVRLSRNPDFPRLVSSVSFDGDGKVKEKVQKGMKGEGIAPIGIVLLSVFCRLIYYTYNDRAN